MFNTFFNWTIISNPDGQPTKTYCLRCGAEVKKQGVGYAGKHTKFCRLRKALSATEELIQIPIDKLVEDGSERLKIGGR